MSKMGKFKIFSKVVKSQIESASDKTGAAEDKINVKFRHHLFFYVKAKKWNMIFTSFPYLERNCPNQQRQ